MMGSKDDLYSKAAAMITNAKRELANGLEKEPIHKLRLQCLSRGPIGIMSLVKTFRSMDDDGNRRLNAADFKKGIRDNGYECDDAEINTMFHSCDADETGTIKMTEFITKLRPPMNKARLAIIEKAFDKVDHNHDNYITTNDLRSVYSVKGYPEYLSGEKTESEILNELLNNFKPKNQTNAKVSKEEFYNYYSTVSASIDHDAYFDLIMRQAYKL